MSERHLLKVRYSQATVFIIAVRLQFLSLRCWNILYKCSFRYTFIWCIKHWLPRWRSELVSLIDAWVIVVIKLPSNIKS